MTWRGVSASAPSPAQLPAVAPTAPKKALAGGLAVPVQTGSESADCSAGTSLYMGHASTAESNVRLSRTLIQIQLRSHAGTEALFFARFPPRSNAGLERQQGASP
jgi:hypothetical protein